MKDENILLKGDSIYRVSSTKRTKTVNKSVWNGRDSDELCGEVIESTVVSDGSTIEIKELVLDKAEFDRIKKVETEIRNLLRSACFAGGAILDRPFFGDYKKVAECIIDEDSFSDINVVVHHGIKGSYVVGIQDFSVMFYNDGNLWAVNETKAIKDLSDIEFNVCLLVESCFEDLGLRLDDRNSL